MAIFYRQRLLFFIVVIGITVSLLECNTSARTMPKLDKFIEELSKVFLKSDHGIFKTKKPFSELFSKKAPSLPTVSQKKALKQLQKISDDPGVQKSFKQLDIKDQKLAVELGESMNSIMKKYGKTDGVIILKNMDKEGLVFHRIFPTNQRPVIEAMYKDSGLATDVLRKTGEAGINFYEMYVGPHKAKWLAGGALAAFYSNPEYFIDETGKITEYAIEKMLKLGVEVTGKTIETTTKTLFASYWGIIIFVAIALIAFNWIGGQFGLEKGWLVKWPARGVFKFIQRQFPGSWQQDKTSLSSNKSAQFGRKSGSPQDRKFK